MVGYGIGKGRAMYNKVLCNWLNQIDTDNPKVTGMT